MDNSKSETEPLKKKKQKSNQPEKHIVIEKIEITITAEEKNIENAIEIDGAEDEYDV